MFFIELYCDKLSSDNIFMLHGIINSFCEYVTTWSSYLNQSVAGHPTLNRHHHSMRSETLARHFALDLSAKQFHPNKQALAQTFSVTELFRAHETRTYKVFRCQCQLARPGEYRPRQSDRKTQNLL